MCSEGLLRSAHASTFNHVHVLIKLQLKKITSAGALHQITTAAEAVDALQTFPNYGSLQARDFQRWM